MAYGNIQGYEPTAVPGAYQFVGKDGQKWTLTGPPAEDLKAKLDASATLQPQMAGKDVWYDDPADPAQRPNETAADFTTRAQTLKAQSVPAAPAAPKPAAPAQAAAPPRGPAASPGGPAGFKQVGPGIYQGPDGRYYEYRAGSAGSKGGLVLRSETRQGVQELDPEFMAKLDANQAERESLLAEQQAAQLAQAEELRKHKEELAAIAANEQAEAVRKQQQIDQEVKDLQGRYDTAERDVANARVNPQGESNFFDTLAMAIGAAYSVLNKQPDTVNAIVQRRIDRQIAAQEHEINIKRETKNDLSRMLEATKGNRELARQALATAYTKKAAATFEARAQSTSNQELKASMGMAALQSQEQHMLRKKALGDAARGEVTQSYVNTPAVAASSGGLAPVKDQLGVRGKIVDQKLKEKELAEPAKGGGEAKPLDATTTDALTASVNAYQLGKKVEAQLPKDATFDPGGVTRYVPFVGADKDAADALNIDTAELASAIQTDKKMGSSDDDANRAEGFAAGTGSVDQRRRQAQGAQANAVRNLTIRLNALPPAQRDQAFKSLPPDVQAAIVNAQPKK